MAEQSSFLQEDFVKKSIFIEAKAKPAKCSEVMHVCFNIDKGYLLQAGVSLTSIIENNPNKRFSFHVFTDEVDAEEENMMRSFAEKYNQDIWFHIMDIKQFEGFHILRKNMHYVTYFRTYMPKVMKKFTNRYLYLDADILCFNSLEPFLKIDFQDKPVAVVEDLEETASVQCEFLHMQNKKYFNSGMMWVNIEEWEKQEVTEKAFSYRNKEPKLFKYHDQDILNLAINGNALFLSQRYNYLPNIYKKLWETEGKEPDNLIFYHYIGNKPWEWCFTKYQQLWHDCCQRSLWRDIDNLFSKDAPKNYKKFRFAAKYFMHMGQYDEALKSLWYYTTLKIKFYVRK